MKATVAVIANGLDMDPFGYDVEITDESDPADAVKALLYHIAVEAAEKSWPLRVIYELAERHHKGLGDKVAYAMLPKALEVGDVFQRVGASCE